MWRQFRKHRLALLGLGCIGMFIIVALFGSYLTPFDPNSQGDLLRTRYLAPSWEHPFGTDKFGRDVFSRVIQGTRISFGIAFAVVIIAISVGTIYGALAGYIGGTMDNMMMRLVDLLLAFPTIFLVITLVAFGGTQIGLLILILGLTSWMEVARLVRGEILSLKEREFIQAVRALGAGSVRILFRHLLPNCWNVVIVAATLKVGTVILVESALSFLGLGVQPPTASWGSIINDGKDVLLSAWWISTFPGLAIVLTVMSFNLVGDGLRDAADPKSRFR
ncbi:MAG: ABC transporter permease [candidate division KSB1 bacterium]|nr:ABC transporter permease [candidate division KSB1 bacterium]